MTRPPHHRPAPPHGPAVWLRDLGMGLRFAAAGGREGWTRTLLTAVGVGLGVLLLLGAASVPHLMEGRQERAMARQILNGDDPPRASERTVIAMDADTTYHDQRVFGLRLYPEGKRAPLPPGVTAYPRPGTMAVSPALRDLLASPDGALLRERLPYVITGTIADPGLVGPKELAYYLTSDVPLKTEDGFRLTHFGADAFGDQPMSPTLLMLIFIACVVLLMPVAVFIATAIRFGGDRRDRRLAALRLVGADVATTRRIAAGEALFGALCGLALGTALFLLCRTYAGSVTLWDINAFPSDVTPLPALAALIAVAVPVAALAVTLFTLRGVAIEPLGVVRGRTARRRRLWWRLPLLVGGPAILLVSGPLDPRERGVGAYPAAVGAALTLCGVTAVLPWVIEAVVGRLGRGPVAWQLAVRRLQLSGGTAARAVSGICVAVAGALALQLLVSALQSDFVTRTGQDSGRAQMTVSLPESTGAALRRAADRVATTEGVRTAHTLVGATVARSGPLRKGEKFAPGASVIVGDCAALREVAQTGACHDGDAFLATRGGLAVDAATIREVARPGGKVLLNADGDTGKPLGTPRLWTVPPGTREIAARKDPTGQTSLGILATPGALDLTRLQDPSARVLIRTDPAVPDGEEHIRNAAAALGPDASASTVRDTESDAQFASVHTGLLLGSTVTMALVAAGLLVTTVEQLRERRRLLSVLVAFGTRRSTLAWSVLWQTAVPIVLGLALAVAAGLGLGAGLLRSAGKAAYDWSAIWPLPLAAGLLVLLVTVLSLPSLWRLMRPDGLRTE
ncbi:FtsX-like permease family protein [Streptomyces catenulae]|uniref:FtsX-like permease family protein n=1 Tax=Streptomyces catenulae TaxID=66875 RepID=A0ABV2YTL4_9ACTN|nr:FtsX-like permease family protein [Streptomyces catenulae]